jgi:hypothetical protein
MVTTGMWISRVVPGEDRIFVVGVLSAPVLTVFRCPCAGSTLRCLDSGRGVAYWAYNARSHVATAE